MAVDPNERWANMQTRALRTPQRVRTRLARMLGVPTSERARSTDSNGVKPAGWWLGRLPEGWHVFHDIPVGDRGARIDHLAIGPGGVFTISRKELTGKVWVGSRFVLHNGHRTDLLSKSAAEARRASHLLSSAVGRPLEVRSVLAILADGWTIEEEPVDVFVRGPRSAKNLMLQQPVTLRPHEVVELAAAAARPSTWIESIPIVP